jgi:hypothetical protein
VKVRVCPERSRSFMRQRIRRVRRVRRVRRRRPEKNARFFPKTGKKNPAENKNLPVSLSGRSRPRRRPRRSGVFWLHRPRLKGLESLTCILRLIVTATRRAFPVGNGARGEEREPSREESGPGPGRRRASVMTNRESRNHRQTSWNVGKNCTNHAGRGGGSGGTGWSSRRGLREL